MNKVMFFASLLMSLILFSNAMANDKYMVEVDVDVTAEDSAKAREQAMNEANRKAFLEIVRKNTNLSYYDKFISFNNEQILNFIKEVGVSEEKSSSYRYAAKLNILVDGELLLAYMKENNIPAAYQNLSYVMVVPIYIPAEGQNALLWEEENEWRKIWEQRGIKQEGNRNFLSIPNIPENNVLTASDFENMSKALFRRLSKNNPSNSVYIVKLVPDMFNYLNIEVINAETGEKSDITIYGSPNEKNFNIAVDMVIARLKSNQPLMSEEEQDKPISKKVGGEIVVVYLYNNPADLIEARKKLDSLPEVEKTSILTLAEGKARILLKTISAPEQIAYSAAKKGFRFVRDGEVYVLTRSK